MNNYALDFMFMDAIEEEQRQMKEQEKDDFIRDYKNLCRSYGLQLAPERGNALVLTDNEAYYPIFREEEDS